MPQRHARPARGLLALALAAAAAARPDAVTASGVPQPMTVDAGEVSAPRIDRRSPIVRAVERALPAVVNISTETLVRNPYSSRSPFEWFFGQPRPRGAYVANSLGSGVIIDPAGYVVTNEHVVTSASRITVTFSDGRQLEAEPVGSAPRYDLAILKLAGAGPFPHLSPDFDETLHAGETVIAMGNPFGLQSSVTSGILSSAQRTVESGGEAWTDFLQTDAAINPGNSGGALLTVNGDLIGINTQVDARGQNVGFAIPVARVRKVYRELLRTGDVRAAWLGATFIEPRAGAPAGIEVGSVVAGGPMDRAGLLAGDVLVSLGGRPVQAPADLQTAIARLVVGDAVTLRVRRGGDPRDLRFVAESFPLEQGADLLWRHLGLAVGQAEMSDGQRVVVIEDVRRGSEAAEVGLRQGFALFRMDSQRVDEPEDLYRGLLGALERGSVMLGVGTREGTYRVPLSVE